MGNVMLTLL